MIGGITGIGSSVSGTIGGGTMIGGTIGGAGAGGLFTCDNKQQRSPNKPKSPNRPGHHLQQSSDCRSMMTGAGVGATCLSMTITLVLGGLYTGMGGGGAGFSM